MTMVITFKNDKVLTINNVLSVTSTTKDGSKSFSPQKLHELVLSECCTCSVFNGSCYTVFAISDVQYLQISPS